MQSFYGLVRKKIHLWRCIFRNNRILSFYSLAIQAASFHMTGSAPGLARVKRLRGTLSILACNNCNCYTAGNFFSTARALVGYFEVT